jgi:FkbM family methyltransferase
MGVKRDIKMLFERLTGTRVYRSAAPRGVNFPEDLRLYLPALHVSTIFDVGANVGQSAKSFAETFPHSTIYSFEPVERTFQRLKYNVREYDNILNYKLALGAIRGKAKIAVEEDSKLCALLEDAGLKARVACVEEVELETLDTFCRNHAIGHINFLKIDTEGSDLRVLTGAEEMINRQQVDAIQVEAGMNINNRWHIAFDTFSKLFQGKNYFLFGIYEQVNEWPKQMPHLRRTNCVFISRSVIDANSGAGADDAQYGKARVPHPVLPLPENI